MKQVLSIKQMRHLQELGLNLGETLLYWCRIHDNRPRAATRYGKWILCKGHNQPTVSICGWEYVPAYTLQDVLELLPKEIKPAEKRHWLRIDLADHCLYYYHEGADLVEHRDKVFLYGEGEEMIDAAYNALCWCIENGYVVTEKEEQK